MKRVKDLTAEEINNLTSRPLVNRASVVCMLTGLVRDDDTYDLALLKVIIYKDLFGWSWETTYAIMVGIAAMYKGRRALIKPPSKWCGAQTSCRR